MAKRTVADRFWEKVDKSAPGGCWLWTAFVDKAGYARIRADGESRYGHRWSYEQAYGPIPAGMTVDHECHNRDAGCAGRSSCLHRRCVNPAHLGLATKGENSRRSPNWLGHRQFCVNGHPYNERNTGSVNGYRRCAECHRERERARYAAARGQ